MDTIVTPVTVITLDSTRIVHSIKADFVARYFPPVVRLVQYDQSLPVIAVSLMQNGQAYTLPSGAAANIRVHKPDSTYVYNPALGCDSTRKIVYFEVTQAMAAASGDGLAIVEIVVDGDIAGTSLITLHFEENPVPEDAIESSDEWETIYELGERIIASTVTPVSTAAGMTDHNVVYLYTGTESGWNQGHMYYYNGTTWVDAGIAVTDTTLSVAGLAADAKKTGDEIADLKDGLSYINEGIGYRIVPVSKVVAPQAASGTTLIKADPNCKCFIFNCSENTDLSITLEGTFNRFVVFGATIQYDINQTYTFTATYIASSTNYTSGSQLNVSSGNYQTIAVYAVASNASMNPTCVIYGRKNIYKTQSKKTLVDFINGNYESAYLTVCSTNRIRTNPINVKKGEWLDIKPNGQKYILCEFDRTTKQWIQLFQGWSTLDYTFVFNGYCKTSFTYSDDVDFFIMVAKNDNADLTPADLDAEINLYTVSDSTLYEKEINERKKNLVTIGSPETYFSEATASSYTNIKDKTLSDLYAVYDNLVANYPDVIQRGEDLGNDGNGNAIRQYIVTLNKPYVVVGEVSLSGVLPPDTPNEWDDANNNKTILVNTGCHGNEKSPTWGVALAIKELVESGDKWAEYLKGNYTIKVLPCMNPYGFANNSRSNANNADLNRDCAQFTQSESQAWKSFIDNNKDALIYLDCHGTSGYYAYFEALNSDKYYQNYLQAYLKFTSCVNENWKNYWSFNVNPYCLFIRSTYSGMTINYTGELGIPGHILETPQDTDHAETGGWGDDLRSCKITKDLLINAMQIYGEYFNK